MPHKGGLIPDGYDRTITVSTFEKALKKLWERYDRRHVSIYISFLLLETDGIWKNLPVAVDKFGRNNFTDACAVTQKRQEGFRDNKEDKENEDEVSECEEFTTLDKLMFRLVIDSVSNQQGSLDTTQMGDVIEEIISLNSDRRRSFFTVVF